MDSIATLLRKRSTCKEKTDEDKIDEEIQKYLALPEAEYEEEPLEWWKRNSGIFPLLSYLAKQYLCVLGTRVPSERVFSCGGNMITDLRSSLTATRSEQLVVLSMNQKYIPKHM